MNDNSGNKYCKVCDKDFDTWVEIEPKPDQYGKNLLEFWKVSIRKVIPDNVSLSQMHHGDLDEGRNGSVCKDCLVEWYPNMKFEKQNDEVVN